MRSPILLLVPFSFLLPLALQAGRTPGFSMSAFNAAVPASNVNVAFSPIAYEFDCVVISEAFDSIKRAKYVETLGALVGYDSVYKPLMKRCAESTNGVAFVSTRAFLTPSFNMVDAKFRTFIQNEYGAHACGLRPSSKGAECFLRASMDGEMDDFSISGKVTISPEVSFCDLVSVRAEMKLGVRNADLWNARRFTMLRLAIADGFCFYAAMPNEGETLDSIRGSFAADKLEEALSVFRAVGDPNVYRGYVDISIPKMSIDSSVDLMPAFKSAQLPLGGFKELKMGPDTPLAHVWQRTRFTLDEGGSDETSVEDGKPRPAAVDRSFACNRPFLFFVYHEPTRTIPVAGVHAGVAK